MNFVLLLLQHRRLSGTESAILTRESGDSDSCDLNCAIGCSYVASKIDGLRFGLAILNRFSATLAAYCDSTRFLLLAVEILAIRGLQFWNHAIRDSAPLMIVGELTVLKGTRAITLGPKPPYETKLQMKQHCCCIWH